MTQILRQSTQVIVRIGPAVAVGDGFTPVTTLALSTADEAELLKANTTTTTDISGATMAAITGCDGYYGLTLTTSLTDTVGCLDVMINDDSLILPIFARFQVIEEAAYDAMYAASAAPATAANQTTIEGKIDTIDGNVDAVLVDTGTTLDGKLDTIDNFLDTEIAAIKAVTDNLPDAGALTSLATAAALATVDGNVDAILVDTGTTLPATLATIAAFIDTEVAAILQDTGTDIPALIAALNNLSSAEAQVAAAAALTAYDPPTKAETDALLTTALTESYNTDGSAPTVTQALLGILQMLTEKSVSGTTVTVKKLDGATTAMTLTLDDGTTPTSITRSG